MGIVNRTLDTSEQKKQIIAHHSALATGVDALVYRAPCAMTIADARATSVGLSGAPTSTLRLQRPRSPKRSAAPRWRG